MDIHPTDLVLCIINIIVLFLLLRLILWKPIYRALSARSQLVKETLEGAEQTKTEALTLKEEYLKGLDGLEAQGREIIRASHIQAGEEAKDIIASAKAQANDILAEAQVRIESEKAIAIARAREEIAQLATDMAARILRREVSTSDNVGAVKDFFSESR